MSAKINIQEILNGVFNDAAIYPAPTHELDYFRAYLPRRCRSFTDKQRDVYILFSAESKEGKLIWSYQDIEIIDLI